MHTETLSRLAFIRNALFLFLLIPASLPGQDKENQCEKIYDQLMAMEPDPAHVSVIEGLTFRRDAATFQLVGGKLYWATPVEGRVVAAIFHGKGTFLFTPSTIIERDHLGRFYGKKSASEEFNRLFILFGDSTFEQLQTMVPAASGSVPLETRQALSYMREYAGDKEQKGFHPTMMSTLLNNEHNEFFFAVFSSDKRLPYYFEVDPLSEEEVRFGHRLPGDVKYTLETISQFHRQEEYQNPALQDAMKDDIRVAKYVIDCIVEDDLDFSAKATLIVESQSPYRRWFHGFLLPDLEVDSVRWGSDRPAQFFKEELDYRFWAMFDRDPAGREDTLHIWYHGELFRRYTDYVLMKSSYGWFPVHGERRKSQFDMSFSTPASMKFASVGTLRSSRTEGDKLLTTWSTDHPVRNASFSIGYYEELRVDSAGIPPVSIHMTAQRPGMIEDVAGDVAKSLAFYQHGYGPSGAQKLTAWEIPFAHGEAFPEMIQLSFWTFNQKDRHGLNEMFRAHEVAHQWWGIGVDFRTYHDQWLSEGAAEYASLCYLQFVKKDNVRFFDVLKEWRTRILNNREFVFGSGQQAGPVWLGYRTLSAKTKDDYNIIVYKKGAWVMHMLRNMMLNLETMKEDSYWNLTRNLYSTFKDSTISTQEFSAFLTNQLGMDMSWFIKQWIYETDVPTYKFAHTIRENEEGRFVVSCRIEQSNVSDSFLMVVPIFLDLGQGKFERFRTVVQGKTTQFELPPVATKPREVIFNALESVLCEVEYVDW